MKLIRPSAINDTTLTSSDVPETDYTAWSSATTYAVGDRVIVTTGYHKIYESLVASNLNNNPTTDSLISPKWVEVSATNRWKMFDTSMSSKTTNTDSIDVSIAVAGRANSIAILGVSAASITITMTDSVEGVVYSRTVNMTSDSGIVDWYAYYFEDIIRRTDVVFTDLPPYANSVINVVITGTGSTVECGALIIGQQKILGTALLGTSAGITDYSRKERNDYGDYVIVQRAFNKRASFSFIAPNTTIGSVQATLAEYRAIPIVYIGDEQYESTIVFGFYKDFDINIAYPTISECTLEIEGLT